VTRDTPPRADAVSFYSWPDSSPRLAGPPSKSISTSGPIGDQADEGHGFSRGVSARSPRGRGLAGADARRAHHHVIGFMRERADDLVSRTLMTARVVYLPEWLKGDPVVTLEGLTVTYGRTVLGAT